MPHDAAPHHAHVHETAPLHDSPDQWHDHTRDEKPQHGHAEVGNAPLITAVGVGLFLVIVLACVAVYAYYSWFITGRLSYSEMASSETSPALQARDYKQKSVMALKEGGPIDIQADGDAPEIKYTLTPIQTQIGTNAGNWVHPPAALTPPALAPPAAPQPKPQLPPQASPQPPAQPPVPPQPKPQ